MTNTQLSRFQSLIENYGIQKTLKENGRSFVTRAIRKRDRHEVVIKARLETEHTISDRRRARSEFAILRALDSDFAPKAFDFISLDFGSALIMEDVVGVDLERLLGEGVMSIAEALDVGERLATALADLRRARVIHKDIKPANIIFDRERRCLRLVDFASATMLPRERLRTEVNVRTVGTLAYMAPEQTGRMNSSLDERCDLYSAGVTLFQLLTGRLPFEETDPLSLVYAHMAHRPPRVDALRNDVPVALADIVDRLLAKNPEDRYQTAEGLAADLRRCQDGLRTRGAIASFPIGASERVRTFRVAEKLYGREPARRMLLDAFDRVVSGGSEVVLISGHSGIGKTALVNEIEKPMLRQRGLVLRGKFDQFNRSTPCSAIGQALDGLARQWLTLDPSAFAVCRERLVDALAHQGQIILEIAPALAPIIGDQPPAPELSAGAAKQRLKEVFLRLTSVLRSDEQPLVLFLDDLQWADPTTLDLLETLAGQVPNLLILGAYRDNEVAAGHPVLASVQAFERQGVRLTSLALSALEEEDLVELIADSASAETSDVQPLAQLLHQRTLGNPFFAVQMLARIENEGSIAIENGRLRYDLEALGLAGLTSDVVDLMTMRLSDQPASTCQALGIAACIGNEFEVGDLTAAMGTHAEQLAKALWPALSSGLILPMGDACGHPDLAFLIEQGGARFRFLHDRVQQAAYQLLPEADRERTHVLVGKCWWRAWDQATRETRLFDLLGQLNHTSGFSGDSDSEDWSWRLAELNLQAGLKAKAATAFRAASEFFENGRRFAGEDAWSSHYSLIYKLHLHGAEAAFLNGDFAAAEELYDTSLELTEGVLDRARIFRVQATQYQLQGRNQDALRILRRSLGELGWDPPDGADEAEQSLDLEIENVCQFVEDQGVERVLELLTSEDASFGETLRLLQILFYAAWRSGETPLALLALSKMTTLSIERGHGELSPFGFVGFGLVASVRLKDYELAYQFGDVAVRLCDRFCDPDVTAMTNYMFAADVLGWSRPLRETEPFYEAAYRAGLEAGNHLTVGFMMQQSGAERLAYGENLHDLLEIANGHAAFLKRIGNVDNLSALQIAVIQPIKNLQGTTRANTLFDDEMFEEADFLDRYGEKPYYLAWYYASRMRLAVLWNDHDVYADLIDKLDLIEAKVPSHANKVPASVFHAGLMAVSLAEHTRSGQRQGYRERAEACCGRLARWAKSAPLNVRHKWLLLKAELARLDGDPGAALERYDDAVDAARTAGCWHELALAHELTAKFLLAWGKPHLARHYIREAIDGYAHWGASAKAKVLKERFGEPLTDDNGDLPTKGSLNSIRSIDESMERSHVSLGSVLDVNSILKAAQTLSEHQETAPLLRRMVEIIGENAGADHSRLYVMRGDDWRVAAASGLDGCEASGSGEEAIRSALVRYAGRLRQPLLVDRDNDLPLSLVEHDGDGAAAKSRLVMPALNKGELIALFYLENSLTDGVFSSERLDILGLLSTQAAIALQNARLFEDLEEANSKLEDRSRTLERQVEARTSELKIANKQLEVMAGCDALTGLGNRRYFGDKSQERWRRAAERGEQIGVIIVDVDHFKRYNDYYGHQAGDACLRRVADVLLGIVPNDKGLLARYGGEEFIILLHPADLDVVKDVGRSIVDTVASAAMPHVASDVADHVTVSVGACLQCASPARSLDRLVTAADEALYRAKHLGRNRFELFSEALQSQLLVRRAKNEKLIRAIDQGEFEPYFQPQLDGRSGKLLGLEVLARWPQADGRVLPPCDFIAEAEELGVIGTLDHIVLTKAIAHRRVWRQKGLGTPRISVNISAKRLDDRGFIGSLDMLSGETDQVAFELVETILFDDDHERMAQKIGMLRELGIEIEIDDFGTGRTSIVSLTRIRPDRLKIDQQLVAPIILDSKHRAVVQSVVEIGKALNIDVIAEGVETMEHANVLATLGCHSLQGYALSKPMPAGDVERWLLDKYRYSEFLQREDLDIQIVREHCRKAT